MRIITCEYCQKRITCPDWVNHPDTWVDETDGDGCEYPDGSGQTTHKPGMHIFSNNVPRDLIRGYELTEKEQKDFDYYVWPKEAEWREADYPSRWGENGPLNPIYGSPGNWGSEVGWDKEFFRYRGQLYDLNGQFLRYDGFNPELAKWDGYWSDSAFSGILVKYPKEDFGRYGETTDTEHVIVGRYYC